MRQRTIHSFTHNELRNRRYRPYAYCRACGRELSQWRYFCICLVCQDWAREIGVNLYYMIDIEIPSPRRGLSL